MKSKTAEQLYAEEGCGCVLFFLAMAILVGLLYLAPGMI